MLPFAVAQGSEAPRAAENVDVVVVGGGLSGLWAAHELKQRTNLSVVVLEGRDRVGGRLFSTDPGSPDTFDLGGHWVGSTQYHVLRVIKDLALETYKQWTTGTKVMEIDGKIRTYKTTIPFLPLMQEANFAMFAALTEWEISRVSRDAPWNWSQASHFDGITTESFCSAFPWRDETRQLTYAASLAVFGKELSELSILQYVHYAACVGGLMPLLDASPGGGQEFKVNGGTQQMPILLAKNIDVRYNSTVVGIDVNNGAATVRTLDGRTFGARRVVMAIPPHLAAGIWYNPPLSAKKEHLLSRMTQGHLIKVMVTYEKAFWRDNGFSGEVVSSTPPLSICYDDSTPAGTPALICFVGGATANRLSPATVEQRRGEVLDGLTKYFGPEAKNFKQYVEKDWGLEPLTGGCPVGSMNAGTISQWGDAIREMHGPIHFGGTETATWWYGYMNGAVQAGERCAIEVMEALSLAVPQDMHDFYNLGGKNKPPGALLPDDLLVA